MRLALFCATGLTGIQIIEQALVGKNRVIAYARNPSIIGLRYERLVIVEGELSDAVISVLGPHPGEDRNNRSLSLYGFYLD